jgi:hypothetical protein
MHIESIFLQGVSALAGFAIETFVGFPSDMNKLLTSTFIPKLRVSLVVKQET